MKTKVILTTILVGGVLCVAASAQDTKKKAAPAPGAMAMPKPAPEMKEVRALIGTWTSDETYEPGVMGPAAGTGAGTNTARLGPGGFSVLMDQRSKTPMGPFSGHGVCTLGMPSRSRIRARG